MAKKNSNEGKSFLKTLTPLWFLARNLPGSIKIQHHGWAVQY